MKRKQNKKPNRILWAILTPIFAAIIGFGVWWTVSNWNTIQALFTGTQIYTHEQVQDAYNQGYLEGNEAEEDYQTLIIEYQNSIDSLQVQKTELQVQVEELEAQIATLQSTSSENQTLIDSLQADLAEITTLYENLQVELQNTIIYYEQLLEAYADVDKYIVAFKVEGEQYEIRLIEEGAIIGELPIVESTEHFVFNYWEIAGQQITADELITSDTVVSANVTHLTFATFILEGSVYDEQTIEKDTIGITISTPDIGLHEFVGWSLDGTAIIDLSNYQMSEDVTFTAIVNHRFEIRYVYMKLDGTFPSFPSAGLNVLYEGQSLDTTLNTYLEGLFNFVGYSFTEGAGYALVDLSNYTVMENKTIFVVVDYYKVA